MISIVFDIDNWCLHLCLQHRKRERERWGISFLTSFPPVSCSFSSLILSTSLLSPTLLPFLLLLFLRCFLSSALLLSLSTIRSQCLFRLDSLSISSDFSLFSTISSSPFSFFSYFSTERVRSLFTSPICSVEIYDGCSFPSQPFECLPSRIRFSSYLVDLSNSIHLIHSSLLLIILLFHHDFIPFFIISLTSSQYILDHNLLIDPCSPFPPPSSPFLLFFFFIFLPPTCSFTSSSTLTTSSPSFNLIPPQSPPSPTLTLWCFSASFSLDNPLSSVKMTTERVVVRMSRSDPSIPWALHFSNRGGDVVVSSVSDLWSFFHLTLIFRFLLMVSHRRQEFLWMIL